MKVITYSTQPRGYFTALEASSKRHGYELVVLGLGKPWQGFMQRCLEIENYLDAYSKSSPSTANEIVAVVDAYDVVIAAPPYVTRAKYDAKIGGYTHGTILMGAEKDNMMAQFAFGPFHPGDKHKEYPRVNFGCCMGSVQQIRMMLSTVRRMCVEDEEIDEESRATADDQYYASILYTQVRNGNGPPGFQMLLDHDAHVFMNVCKPWSQWFRVNIPALSPDQMPCFIHGPGNTNIDDLVKQLNLPVPTGAGKKARMWHVLTTNYFHYISAGIRRLKLRRALL
ncbi:hypothetical protein EBZ80_20180 [bacterium]|nr:hypothetical protein [bacterium]